MKIIFAGDLALIKNQPVTIDSAIVSLFDKTDHALINLEAPILNSPKNIEKYPKAGPNIFQTKEVINIINNLKIKYIGGANNHMADYCYSGIKSTIDELNQAGIRYGGFGATKQEASTELTLGNSNIDIICVAEEEFGVAQKNKYGIYSIYDEELEKQISSLKEKLKIVILFTHGGPEEVPLPSKYIIGRYRKLIDAGADLIIGHHPHVVQGYEKYQGKFIFYSLGNLIHQGFSRNLGLILIIEIEGKNIKIKDMVPILFDNNTLKLAEKEYFLTNLEKINRLYSQPNLFDAVYQEQAIYMYEKYYRQYFTGLFSENQNIKIKFLNFILRKTTKTTTRDERMLLHLLRNQSHRDFIETALKIKTREIENLMNNDSKIIFRKIMSNE